MARIGELIDEMVERLGAAPAFAVMALAVVFVCALGAAVIG